jgi:hypothetical protein
LANTNANIERSQALKLRDDNQEVHEQQVGRLEPPPGTAEALDDQPRVAHPRDRPKPHHHLLVDDQDGHEQQQHPQQAHLVVLAGLGVGRDTAGVVVANHHDQPRADDREQRERLVA